MKHLISLASLALASSLGSLWAQPQTGVQSADPLADSPTESVQAWQVPGRLTELGSQLLIDEPGDGRTWARGPQWKASFGPEGMTYIPFLGSDAPRNFPIVFDLESVQIHDMAMPLDERVRVREGQQVELQRGSVREVYHLQRDTVEQTFVFDQLPQRGALELEIAVDTALTPVADGAGGLYFQNDLGQVHYSAPIAFDARGLRQPLPLALTEKGLTITVPAEFVQRATLPLVVDPVLNTFSVIQDTRTQVDVDVAYEGNNATYQIVYSERQSLNDTDIIALSYNASLDLLISPGAIDITSENWRTPSNASCFHEGQFLCTALVGTTINFYRAWGRTRSAATGSFGPQFQISGVGAESVDVGGKGNDVASNYDYMVVWQEVDGINLDMDIVAQAVRADSTLTGSRITIDGDVGDFDLKPSISKSSGRPSTGNSDNEYMIVWERRISPTDHNIRAQVIEYTGVMTGHNQFNAYTFSDSLNPDVSTVSDFLSYNSAPYWVIAFERRVGTEYKIFTVVARDGNADNARNIHTMQNLEIDLDHRDPAIAFDSQDYLVTYQTESASGDRAVHFTGLNVVHDDGELRTGLSTRRETLTLSDGAPASIGLASHWDGGGPNSAAEPGDALALWIREDGVTMDSAVEGAVIAEVRNYVAGSQYCEAAINSSGTSAWMRAEGSFWNPGYSYRLTCEDMPQNVFGHFIASNQQGFTLNPGGSQGHLCLQGAIGRYNAISEIVFSGATGSVELWIDSDEMPTPFTPVMALSGETWSFQCWFRDNGPNSNFSNGVGVTFD